MLAGIVISLAVGAVVTSTVEYKLKYNLVDKIIDLFRNAESKAARAADRLREEETRFKTEVARLKAKVKL